MCRGNINSARKCASTSPQKWRFLSEREEDQSSGLDGTTCFFNLLTSRSANVGNLDREILGEVPITEDFHVIITTIHDAYGAQKFFSDHGAILEVFFERGDVHTKHLGLVVVIVEAALRQTTVKRHLTTFKADTDSAAGASFLSFVAFAGGFAVTGAFTATKTLHAMLGSGIGR